MKSCAVLMLIVLPFFAACGGSAGGGVPGASTVAEVLPPAPPTLAPLPTLPEIPADVTFTGITRNPSMTSVFPGQCGADLHGFTFVWTNQARPSFEQIRYRYNGTGNLKQFASFKLVTAQSDVQEEAPYRILRDDEKGTVTIDFNQGAWYPRDYGREPVKYYFTACADPSIATPSFSFTLDAVQLHETGATADLGDPKPWAYTVRKADGYALPAVVSMTRTSTASVGISGDIGSLKVSCPAADKQSYCVFNTATFDVDGVFGVALEVEGATYGAWGYCVGNCVTANLGYVVMAGETKTFTVIGTPYREQYSLRIREMLWTIGPYAVMPDVPATLELRYDGTAVYGQKG